MIKTGSAEISVEKSAGDNSHYDIFGRELISQPEIARDKEFAVTEYPFKEFDFDNDDDLLELEIECKQ